MNKVTLTDMNLSRDEFDNLIFMGPPPIWEQYSDKHEFLLSLCFHPLKEVVRKLRYKKHSLPWERSEDIFNNIQNIVALDNDGNEEKRPWFYQHKILNENFQYDLMKPVWVRNMSKYGKEKEYGDKHLYLQDGNHRLLVYAIRVACNEEKYDPVKAIHATSWKFAEGILRYTVQAPEELINNGELHPPLRDYVCGFDAKCEIFKRLEK